MATQAERFPVRHGVYTNDPVRHGVYTNDTTEGWLDDAEAAKQSDIYTADVWMLHLRVPSSDSVQALADKIRHPNLTGDYLGGDSFHEWCEPYKRDDPDQPGRALHVRFIAYGPHTASLIGKEIARWVGYTDPRNFIITTAGDWGEYIKEDK